MIKVELPQMILTGLILIGMGISMSRFGQDKKDKYDAVDVLIAPAIIFALLWWGGFYG